jgi:hypothetical protein
MTLGAMSSLGKISAGKSALRVDFVGDCLKVIGVHASPNTAQVV